MAASAQSASGMREENHITISPATSNKGVEFKQNFDQLFGACTLQAAFENHPAFTAVFKSKQGLDGHNVFGGFVSGPEAKFPGEIVALSTGSMATTTTKGGLTYVSKGLISSIMIAYNTHCHLVISPDDVWLTILAQFCAYANKNAEGLRNKIVDHEGKKELKVECDGTLHTADYQRMIRDLLGLIRQNIKSPDLADWFRPGFSTTTDRDEVCAAATAMASLQAYFEYTMVCACGIPSVTLMGVVGDWKLLREKIERLLEFEVDGNPDGKVMETWVGYLRKVCDGFVESAEHPDSAATLEFWDKVLSHIPMGSGMNYTTGWVSAFTCFDKDGNFLGKIKAPKGGQFPILGDDDDDLDGDQEHNGEDDGEDGGEFPMIGDDNICHNVVSCPVKIKIDDNGHVYDGTLFSGQTACEGERAGETGHPTVRPRNDWCLAVAVKE